MDRLDTNYLEALVVRAQAGNANSFAELYTATYQGEFAYAYRNVGDRDLAKKVLEDTYGRALREISHLTEPDMVLAWLYRLNFLISQELLRKKREEKLDDSMTIDGHTYYVTQLIRNLPMTEAQVLIMHFYQGYSLKEISSMVGISSRTLKWNLRGGRAHLRKLMRN